MKEVVIEVSYQYEDGWQTAHLKADCSIFGEVSTLLSPQKNEKVYDNLYLKRKDWIKEQVELLMNRLQTELARERKREEPLPGNTKYIVSAIGWYNTK